MHICVRVYTPPALKIDSSRVAIRSDVRRSYTPVKFCIHGTPRSYTVKSICIYIGFMNMVYAIVSFVHLTREKNVVTIIFVNSRTEMWVIPRKSTGVTCAGWQLEKSRYFVSLPITLWNVRICNSRQHFRASRLRGVDRKSNSLFAAHVPLGISRQVSACRNLCHIYMIRWLAFCDSVFEQEKGFRVLESSRKWRGCVWKFEDRKIMKMFLSALCFFFFSAWDALLWFSHCQGNVTQNMYIQTAGNIYAKYKSSEESR